jgi:hypothetical protein
MSAFPWAILQMVMFDVLVWKLDSSLTTHVTYQQALLFVLNDKQTYHYRIA